MSQHLAPRVLVCQDEEAKLDFWKETMHSEATRLLNEPVSIDQFWLFDDFTPLLDSIANGDKWYDWMLLDLIAGEDIETWEDSTGVRLLCRLAERKLFGKYRLGAPHPQHQVNGVAICSAVFGYSSASGEKLKPEMEGYGVRPTFIYPVNEVRDCCAAICQHMIDAGRATRKPAR